MEKYGFPLLQLQEIQNILAEMGHPMNQEDLTTKLSSTRLQPIFEFFLQTCMGLSRDNYLPTHLNNKQMSNMETQMETVHLLGFLYKLRTLAHLAGITDFTIRDYIKPEPGRIRKVLSGVINFAKFNQDRQHIYEKLDDESAHLEEERETLRRQQNELLQHVNALKLQRKEQEPEIKSLKEANDTLGMDLRDLKKKNNPLVTEIENLKKRKEDITLKISNNSYATVNLRQEIQQLKIRVVPQDPEKLKLSIEQLNDALRKEQEAVTSNERKIKEIRRKIEIGKALHEKIKPCVKSIEEAENEINKCENEEQCVRELRQSLESKELEQSNLQADLERLKKIEGNHREKLEQILAQAQIRSEELEKQWLQSENAYKKMKQDDSKNEEQILSEQKYIEELERKMASMRDIIEKNRTEMTTRFINFKNLAEARLQELQQIMEDPKYRL
ncbi:hypothetical protein G9A89_013857 [Geosiphon pyriformis]|nr:hypothetical protein G9A89_013857 [Geosiphon pyriformis]